MRCFEPRLHSLKSISTAKVGGNKKVIGRLYSKEIKPTDF